MGRYRKNAIQVYFSDEELAFLKKRMKELGYTSISKYFREAALQCAIFDVDTDGIFQGVQEVAKEVHKVGVNINQIARRVNETNEVYKDDIEQIMRGQQNIWRMLEQKLLSIP